jgi:hypothetical protein
LVLAKLRNQRPKVIVRESFFVGLDYRYVFIHHPG